MGADKPGAFPKPHAFLALVRRLTAVRAIRFSYHAEKERMEERDFDVEDVIETLSHGELKGPSRQESSMESGRGNWSADHSVPEGGWGS